MKTSLRRLGAVFLSLALLLGLLAGCGAAPVYDNSASYADSASQSAPWDSQSASQSTGESEPDALPEGEYHECDIDTLGADRRGAKRLVYSDDGRIYYTEDHYESFTLLYGEED